MGSVAQKLLETSEELRWLPVPEFLCVEELLKAPLFRSCCPFDELRLQGIVRCVFGRGEEEVSYLCDNSRLERGHNIVEHGPLLSDVSGSELGLNLSKPDMRVRRPEWRELDAHGSNVSA